MTTSVITLNEMIQIYKLKTGKNETITCCPQKLYITYDDMGGLKIKVRDKYAVCDCKCVRL